MPSLTGSKAYFQRFVIDIECKCEEYRAMTATNSPRNYTVESVYSELRI